MVKNRIPGVAERAEQAAEIWVQTGDGGAVMRSGAQGCAVHYMSAEQTESIMTEVI